MVAPITVTGIAGRLLTLPSGLFIDNEFVESVKSSTLETINPSNGAALGTVSAAEKEDVDVAVSSAKLAFQSWRTLPGSDRSALLLKLAELIERDADDFATLECLDAGVLYGDSKGLHVSNAVATLRYFAGWADKMDGRSMDIPGGIAYTRREPIGVCATIVPWNAPLMITIWKIGPAIASGNTLVIKTAELSPLYGIKLAQLVKEASFPPGVINILTGFGHIAGKALSEHMDVKKIAFTGSGLVGREIMIAAAKSNFKKVTLELGGKGASIVFDDAQLDNALFWTTLGITSHNGQICAAGSRLYIQAGIYDRFIKEFRERSIKAVAGDPLLPNVTKGPMISPRHLSNVLGYIKKGVASGATLLHGGNGLQNASGNYIENTAFIDVGPDMAIMKEEIFGPVASIAKFSSEREVVALANASEYGLSSAVFTSDISRAHRISNALESGQVTINCWGAITPNAPFGGVKQSGFGRDMGEEALESWTNVKAVKINILADEEAS